MAHKDTILIVGFPCSNTSMVTRTLNLCGLYLGFADEITTDDKQYNPDYHWEHLELRERIYTVRKPITDFNTDEINNDFDWMSLYQTNNEMQIFTKKCRMILKSLHANSTGNGIGFKSTYSSLVLPFWKIVEPNFKIIWCFNKPQRAASIYEKHTKISPNKSANLWSIYNNSIKNFIDKNPDVPYIITHTDKWKSAPKKNINRLLEFCEMDADGVSMKNARSNVDAYLSHQNSEDKFVGYNFWETPSVYDWLVENS